MQERLGVPVVVSYKPGAGGAIATQYVARAKPDGYTMVMVLAAHAINPSLYSNLPYDSVKDFTPISMVAKLPLALYTNPKFAPKTVLEFIQYAKEHPGRLRSEEHTSELQSLMRISYAVFCLKKKTKTNK